MSPAHLVSLIIFTFKQLVFVTPMKCCPLKSALRPPGKLLLPGKQRVFSDDLMLH